MRYENVSRVSETTATQLQYRLDGPEDAPVLILGPSLGTTWHMWDRQVPELTKQWRVFRFDLPGHGGAPAYVKPMLQEVAKTGDAEAWVADALATGKRIMGFGHRIYRAEDPRSRILKRTAQELGSDQVEVAEKLEQAALAELRARRPDRVLETNVEFWAAIVLDFAEVPAHMFTSMFTCARVAGWSAHILEQHGLGRLVRPSAKYVGPAPRKPQDVEGWAEIPHGH